MSRSSNLIANESKTSASSLSNKNSFSSNKQDKVEPYEPPESLWQLIKSVAEERELDSIKSIIGESLIETSIDLHNEIDSLLEIWRDYRNETYMQLNKSNGNSKLNGIGGGGGLPEPPNIRETIKKEIAFFVRQMREQHKTEATFCRQIASNKHNLNVINYVLNSTLSTATIDNSKINTDSEFGQNMINSISRGASTGPRERPPSTIDRRTGMETPLISINVYNNSNHANKSNLNTNTHNNINSGRESRQRIRYRSRSRSESVISTSRALSSNSFYNEENNELNPVKVMNYHNNNNNNYYYYYYYHFHLIKKFF
jgi:hypothetical protein